MARRTIVVGLNQTIMAALAMATIASFVDGPGLGQPVVQALIRNDVGTSFVPGTLIVVMAVMLDRSTTAASEARELRIRSGADPKLRRIVLAASAAGALVAVYLSRQYPWAAEFEETSWGSTVGDRVDEFFNWITDNFDGVTGGLKDVVTYGLLNPMQSLLAESPWYVAGAAILALAAVSAASALCCRRSSAWRVSAISICGTTP